MLEDLRYCSPPVVAAVLGHRWWLDGVIWVLLERSISHGNSAKRRRPP